ncbi:[FeFe] hydrogenase H-cluster maturation GTPase HydF [Eubacterium callanderi]|uniref:[FeFe] hydrogenase H-cluster maturation GTPase HydF n=1 Tax=Eubacterium callanderi TaxID=53442 RepID=UPI0008E5C469|nr:[FeFe] hydrogenase H-cluster maturation GTPase HydF [Eubacterium callanderi]MBU5305683.1 [FeFe] hydrogenase H-cluster maturation GTPase HydF [Eubacterium callanderi]WPK67554.1 tRNA modification GTPase MnmE [Eubacterium callanderi]WPK71852.1 tRNA modification GTPase MnmE [Eubacterium callanderi]SFP35416.1 iron-only hydrogenase maturation protein HydF [Eubacterium callanderi]
MSLTSTPRSSRLHIGIYGKRNSGKSSLINALTGQKIALVSDVAGTTADPVYKYMEIHGIGPCMFIDTAGFDDIGELGEMRVGQTRKAMDKTDIALIVWGDTHTEEEYNWIDAFKKRNTPVIPIINKSDILTDIELLASEIKARLGVPPLIVSAKTKEGMDRIREALIRSLPKDHEAESITGNLCADGDLVMLVMPQDTQAPKGRLILPQVQTIRELLDKKCIVHSATADRFDEALACLASPPRLIITDSQVFKTIYDKKPPESKLTSFSVLFAAYKGDLDYFVAGARALDCLTESSRILIAEACTHAPLEEDIGREKIPSMLRKRVGKGLGVDIVAGNDFPQDLTPYNLVIHCGGCMFNRKHVLSRVEQARSQGVPMCNYGVTIAHLSGILDKIDLA